MPRMRLKLGRVRPERVNNHAGSGTGSGTGSIFPEHYSVFDTMCLNELAKSILHHKENGYSSVSAATNYSSLKIPHPELDRPSNLGQSYIPPMDLSYAVQIASTCWLSHFK